MLGININTKTNISININKQLCELCGIDPKYTCVNVPCLNYYGQTDICNVTEERCNPLKCENYRPDKSHRSWKDAIEKYIDFLNPENFIMLMEMKVFDDCDINILGVMFKHFIYNGECTRENILKNLIKYLSSEHYDARTQKAIKERVRNAEWKW